MIIRIKNSKPQSREEKRRLDRESIEGQTVNGHSPQKENLVFDEPGK